MNADGSDAERYAYAEAAAAGRAPRVPRQTEDFLWDGLALVKRGGERTHEKLMEVFARNCDFPSNT